MTNSVIEVRDLTFTYSGSKSPAIKKLTFKVNKGDWFSIIGKNGSGKSTITKLLDGLLLPDEEVSHISIDGVELTDKTIWDIRRKIGIVFQNPDTQFVGATVADDVAFGLENQGCKRSDMIEIVNKVLDDVGMLEYKDSEPENLSGGQKQRVAIAGIIAMKPKILILDEATSMLDPKGRRAIISLVKDMQKKLNLTVISVTHNLDEVVESDQVLVLNDGQKVMQDTPANVFRKLEKIELANLELPFIFQVKQGLIKNGIKIPQEIVNESDLINYLCQLNSRM